MQDPYRKPGDELASPLLVALIVVLLGVFLISLFAGCATPPEVIRSADKLVQHFRMVRTEGRSWDESTWDARLRAFEVEACTVATFVREGTIPKGTAKRCLAEAKAAE